MEFRFRASEESELCPCPRRPRPRPPPNFSSSGFFTGQAMHAGFNGLEGPMGPRPSLEALERELQEERIKEEILARRIAQRRMLEDQARRDMEIEREMMIESVEVKRSHDMMPCDLIRRHEEFDQPLLLGDRPEVERVHEPMKSEVKAFGEEKKLPNQKFAGNKRKIATKISGTSGVKFHRLTQKDWSCALCQVSMTSEDSLNDHLKGKKHLAKAAQLSSSKKSAEPASVKNKSGHCNSSSMPELAAQHKKGPQVMGRKVSIQVNGKMYQVVERGIFLWCMLCRMKCNSKDVMATHLMGKKHLFRESTNKGKSKVWKRQATEEDEESVKEADEPSLSTDGGSEEES